ncbi:hypothetical protein HYX70_01355 [Candidatus Saccharibacteria bacterium]|nr:hypothetical protein [Candidatus Saccharibacteria bacterium]
MPAQSDPLDDVWLSRQLTSEIARELGIQPRLAGKAVANFVHIAFYGQQPAGKHYQDCPEDFKQARLKIKGLAPDRASICASDFLRLVESKPNLDYVHKVRHKRTVFGPKMEATAKAIAKGLREQYGGKA